ncbi:LuxR family transcriptional regulator [Streptomyces sp. NPDC021139]|uniref:LuxR family transcriptional regulator n=1 Tax=unclassified Streptomyces TaxID=2593676 RepID=UPI0033F30B7D
MVGKLRLRGRRGECDALDRLTDTVTSGRSAVLVVHGEPGIGKSALLDHYAERISQHRVVRVAGVESEMELPFAGLHQLCAPFLGRLDRLPAPQSEALATAFGLSSGPPPDRFLVGLAVLSLLSDAATGDVLFCMVDDAQWFDEVSAQTLGFVARRLLAEPVALVLATREPPGQAPLAGLPELVLEGLDDAEARALLDGALRGELDDRIRDRILDEAHGNPLALLELPRGLTATETAEGFGAPAPAPTPEPTADRIEQSFLRQVSSLPVATRRLLLVAAAEPIGDAVRLRRAARQLGIEPGAAAPAEEAGMIDIGALVRFRHPLLRSAVYRSAGLLERQEAHRALADATDRDLDPDRRAWHLAWATLAPDEAVAAELQTSAARAQSRGGVAAAATLLAYAATLTPEPRARAARAVAAASAKLRAGAPDAAHKLLTMAEEGPLDEFGQARADLLRAQIAFASSRVSQTAPLLSAARGLVPLDAALARETFLDAFSAAMFAGRLSADADVGAVARVAREALPETEGPRTADLLLKTLAARFGTEYREAVPLAKRAVGRLLVETDAGEVLRWSWLTSAVAADMWDDEGWAALAARHVRTARATGALSELPLALNSQVLVDLFAGALDAAALLIAEIPTVLEAVGGELAPYGALTLAALQGDEPRAEQLIRSSLADAAARGEGIGVSIAHWARAVLCNGAGKYERARQAADQAAAHTQDLAAAGWGLCELVEAAVRSGERDTAVEAFDRLDEAAGGAGTDWALGVRARARAMLGTGTAAETLYREAIERLDRTRVRMELARAHLLYGEWLRRENRRENARAQLRTAHDMFTSFGAGGFALRSGRELRALGERTAGRPSTAPTALTAQETQIAHLARDGLTNAEIGAELFISPHTVEWHLRKVFAKLGITSRRQLRSSLGDSPLAPAPA